MILFTEYGNVFRYNAHKEAFLHPVLLVLENAKEVTRAWQKCRVGQKSQASFKPR